jgi:D-arabinose 1-dehydrogenase-like Zn-dependent alcohol dehydrogenase
VSHPLQHINGDCVCCDTLVFLSEVNPLLLQDCMDFCSQHNIIPKVELIKADQLDQVYAMLKKNDGTMRYVLDLEAST